MFNKENRKQKGRKALIILLEFLALGIFLYLVISPFLPALKHKMHEKKTANIDWQDVSVVKEQLEKIKQETAKDVEEACNDCTEKSEMNAFIEEVEVVDEVKYDSAQKGNEITEELVGDVKEPAGISEKKEVTKKIVHKKTNRIIIPKIGVNSPIIKSDNYDYALSRGSWMDPIGSTPDQGGNTVITGHRFKYLPPNNLTFYSLDKLIAGDIISVTWDDQDYLYKVREMKVVPKTETSILKKSKDSILTIFTCDPIFSEENRLVVISYLIEE